MLQVSVVQLRTRASLALVLSAGSAASFACSASQIDQSASRLSAPPSDGDAISSSSNDADADPTDKVEASALDASAPADSSTSDAWVAPQRGFDGAACAPGPDDDYCDNYGPGLRMYYCPRDAITQQCTVLNADYVPDAALVVCCP